MSTLIAACRENRFPSLSVLCDYGLDGRDGVNPVQLFELYRNAVIHKKVSAETLENALKTDTLKSIVGINVKSGYGKGCPE
jgi:hypothetical protein